MNKSTSDDIRREMKEADELFKEQLSFSFKLEDSISKSISRISRAMENCSLKTSNFEAFKELKEQYHRDLIDIEDNRIRKQYENSRRMDEYIQELYRLEK